MTSRRFPAPWRVEQIPGGFKVLDASGKALVYVYARETRAEADAGMPSLISRPLRQPCDSLLVCHALRP